MKAEGVMVIGLDGATWKVIDHGIRNGRLPFFAGLKKRGCCGTLLSTVPATTSPALPTFYTGKNPGKHGIFGFVKRDDSLVSLRDVEGKKLWNYLDDTGVRSFLMELRLTYPPERINGVMVSSDRDFPSEDKDFVYPSGLKDVLGDFAITNRWDRLKELRRDVGKNREGILGVHSELVRRKFDAFRRVIRTGPFDFSIIWIAETDSMQHYCWDMPDTLVRLYGKVESEISGLEKALQGWDFIIMSDHGFGSSPRKNFHVNTWLESCGYLAVSGGLMSGLVKRAHFFLGSFMHGRGFVTKVVKRVANMSSPKEGGSPGAKSSTIFPHRVPGLDMGKTKAYLQHKWGISIIRENVGDDEYGKLVDDILRRMRGLRDKDGEKIIKNAWKREELFSGQFTHEIPDIIFQANDDYEPEYHLGPGIVSERPLEKLTGVHDTHREGIFMAFGPDFRRGHDAGKPDIVDITPTLLYMFGAKVPADMDGKVLRGILKHGFKPRRVPRASASNREKEKILKAAMRIRI
jgi:predicted AlkP superfamily phosphohydrolase/phosphomutase